MVSAPRTVARARYSGNSFKLSSRPGEKWNVGRGSAEGRTSAGDDVEMLERRAKVRRAGASLPNGMSRCNMLECTGVGGQEREAEGEGWSAWRGLEMCPISSL